MVSPSIEQRHFAIKAIGGTRELFASKAQVSDPTLGNWLMGRHISGESEAKILEAVRHGGWRFYAGGLVRVAG